MPTYRLTDEAGKAALIEAPEGVSRAEVEEYAQAGWDSWVDGGTYRMVEEASPAAPDPDIPTPTPPEELAAQAKAREERGVLERMGESVRQNVTMGGATDWRNVLGAIPPTASTAPTGIATGAKAVGRMLGLPVSEAPKAASQAANVLARGAKEGYRAPASEVEGAGLVRKAAEMIGGKADVAASAAIGNQQVTNRLAKRALGLRETEPLTSEAIEGVRKTAGKVYEAVKSLPGVMRPTPAFRRELDTHIGALQRMQSQVPGLEGIDKALDVLNAYKTSGSLRYPEAVEAVRNLRSASSKLMAAVDDPAKEVLGRTYRQVANALDNHLEAYLTLGPHKAAGLGGQIKAARELIAKTHDVEDAFNAATGTVDALKLARSADFLTGDLALISDMAKTHGRAMRVPVGDVVQKIAPLDYVIGIAGASTAGPLGATALFARPAIRAAADALAKAGGPHTTSGRRIAENLASLIRIAQSEANVPGAYIGEDDTLEPQS